MALGITSCLVTHTGLEEMKEDLEMTDHASDKGLVDKLAS
jgi:hypothetical protein